MFFWDFTERSSPEFHPFRLHKKQKEAKVSKESMEIFAEQIWMYPVPDLFYLHTQTHHRVPLQLMYTTDDSHQ